MLPLGLWTHACHGGQDSVQCTMPGVERRHPASIVCHRPIFMHADGNRVARAVTMNGAFYTRKSTHDVLVPP